MDSASLRGKTFGNPDKKSLEFSPLLFTVTSTALPLAEISISSKSRNLLQVLQYNVKKKGGKPEKKNKKPYPLPVV
jgi:hypothetical protein